MLLITQVMICRPWHVSTSQPFRCLCKIQQCFTLGLTTTWETVCSKCRCQEHFVLHTLQPSSPYYLTDYQLGLLRFSDVYLRAPHLPGGYENSSHFLLEPLLSNVHDIPKAVLKCWKCLVVGFFFPFVSFSSALGWRMWIQNLHMATLYFSFRKSVRVSSSFLGCNVNTVNGRGAWLLQAALCLV